MPMVVRREAVDAWLDPGLTDTARVRDLLAVTDSELLEAYAVSTEVNSVQNNHPRLVEPISAEETLTPGEPAQDPLL
jgi:putative SOS response-associated peptidase YedK